MPKKKTEVTVPKIMADNRGWFGRLADGLTKENCPKCDKHGGEKTVQREIGVSHRMETEEDEQEERHYNSQGKLTGTTVRGVQVQVRMRIREYHQHYRCYLCGHEWSGRKEDKKAIY